ncbi:YfbM family protein [Cystobacter fuscus]
MSINGNFRRVSADQLSAVLASPEQINDLLDDSEVLDDDTSSTAEYLPMEKNWQALHFLLTGTAWEGSPPLNFIAAGGQPVGEESFGYGPARAFTPEQVKELSRALGGVDREALRRRFNARKMDELEIYPQGWSDHADEESLESLFEDFDALQRFLREGAEQGQALLVFLN